MDAVAYYRVSTKRQGRSGLGLEAQKAAVRAYAAQAGIRIVHEYVEIASGRARKRPVLSEVLTKCRKKELHLLVAKICRLSRRAGLVCKLYDEGEIKFTSVDFPNAPKFLLQILAVIAENEADNTAERTRKGLSVKKAQGKKLGTNGKKLSATNQEKIRRFVQSRQNDVKAAREKGICSLADMALHFNRRGIKTMLGKKWSRTSMHILLKRIDAYANENNAIQTACRHSI